MAVNLLICSFLIETTKVCAVNRDPAPCYLHGTGSQLTAHTLVVSFRKEIIGKCTVSSHRYNLRSSTHTKIHVYVIRVHDGILIRLQWQVWRLLIILVIILCYTCVVSLYFWFALLAHQQRWDSLLRCLFVLEWIPSSIPRVKMKTNICLVITFLLRRFNKVSESVVFTELSCEQNIVRFVSSVR